MLFERLTATAPPRLATWIDAHRAGVRRAVARLYAATPSEGPTLTASGVTYGQPGYYNRGDMVMIEVPTAALDRAWIAGDASNRIGPGGVPNQIGDRYARFQRHLLLTNNGTTAPIHPSTVALSGAGVSFGDGRHRFSVLRDAGIPTVVISVHKKDATKMKKLLSMPVVTLNQITDGEIVDTVDLTIDGERWVWRFPTLANGGKPYLDASPLNANAASRARSLKLARKFVDAYDANPASLPGYRYFTVARPYAGRPAGGRVESRSGGGRRKTGAAGTVVYNDIVVFDAKPDDAEAYAAQLMPMAPDGGPMYPDLAAFADATGGMYAFDKRTLRDAAQRAAKSAWTPFTVQGRRFEALYDDAYRGTLSPWLIRGPVNAQNDHGIYRWSARRHDFVSVDAPAQLRVEVQHEPESEALINDAEIAESMRTQPLSVVKWTDPTSLGPLAQKARLARLSQGSGETFISLPANLTPDDLLDVNDGACVFEVKTIKAIGPNRVVTGTESGYGPPKRAVLLVGPKGSTIERWSGVEDRYVKERVTSLRVVGSAE